MTRRQETPGASTYAIVWRVFFASARKVIPQADQYRDVPKAQRERRRLETSSVIAPKAATSCSLF